MRIHKGYAYDDVLLVPKLSKVSSRKDVSTSIDLGKGIQLSIPIISANMKTVTGPSLASKLSSFGGMPVLHRFDTVENLISNFKLSVAGSTKPSLIAVSVGIKEDDYNLAKAFVDEGCRIICIDVAHGHHERVGNFVRKLRLSTNLHEVLIMAGNVATSYGAKYLYDAGADIIKIGIGPSSVCTTRTQTGNGYPQLSALDNICNDDFGEFPPFFIADGGIKNSGDCVKALCFADLVMIGNLFAGTDEAPGHVVSIDGKKYKEYAGSSTYRGKHVEGVSGLVPYVGSLEDVVERFVDGIKSGCSYQGVKDLFALKLSPEFVEISSAGWAESKPHSIVQV